MKTLEEFLFEGVSDKVGAMSDDQFDQFMKGRTPQEAQGFRDARNKAQKDKKKLNQDKGGALALRKKEDEKSQDKTTSKATTTGGKTAGLGAKPRAKESFNKSKAPKQKRPTVSTYVPRAVQPQKASGSEEERRRKEEEQRRKEKGNRKGLPRLGLVRGAKWAAGKAKDAVGAAAGAVNNTNTNAQVDTYDAK